MEVKIKLYNTPLTKNVIQVFKERVKGNAYLLFYSYLLVIKQKERERRDI